MSVSEWETRLYRRIEEIVAAADDDFYDSAQTQEVAGLHQAFASARSEVAGIRADLAGLRDAVTVLIGSATDDYDAGISALRADVESLTSQVRRLPEAGAGPADGGRDLVQEAIGEAR